jgi:hypothetical protein
MRPDPAPGPQGRSEVKASRTVSGDRAAPRPEIALPGDPARGVVLQGIVVAAVLTVTLLLAWHPLETSTSGSTSAPAPTSSRTAPCLQSTSTASPSRAIRG